MSKLASALDASNFPGKLGEMWKFTFLEIFPKKEVKRECRIDNGCQKYLGIFQKEEGKRECRTNNGSQKQPVLARDSSSTVRNMPQRKNDLNMLG